MKICTFFGHRDAPQSLRAPLKLKITQLIIQQGVDCFYVGNHGQFDAMALSVLQELAPIYPQIKYYIVYAYLPKEKTPAENIILPEGIEFAHPKSAIPMRNEWMVDHSDCVITYVRVTRIIRTSFLATNIRHQFVKRLECINILSSAFSCC